MPAGDMWGIPQKCCRDGGKGRKYKDKVKIRVRLVFTGGLC